MDRQLFAKTGSADALALFEAEVEALTALGQYADSDVLVVPQPLSLNQLPHGAVLLLPWLPLARGGQQFSWSRFSSVASGVSRAQNPQRFGWHRDGYIGAGAAAGGVAEALGATLLLDLRLRPQLQLLRPVWELSAAEVEAALATEWLID